MNPICCVFHVLKYIFILHLLEPCNIDQHILLLCVCVLVAQSCPTLWDPMGYSPPGSSVHGIFQARIPEWLAISFSRGSSSPRDWTWVSCIAGRLFTIWVTREVILDKKKKEREKNHLSDNHLFLNIYFAFCHVFSLLKCFQIFFLRLKL